jgi:hypothetical protein
MSVDVVNQVTGQSLSYTLTPQEALIHAVRQARGRMDWWAPDYGDVPIQETSETYTHGDWSVRKAPSA